MGLPPRGGSELCKDEFSRYGRAGRRGQAWWSGQRDTQIYGKGHPDIKAMQQAQPKRVGEMQAGQFQEGDRLQEGPREKSKEQESLFSVSKGSHLASSHCHSTGFYRPDTEVGPWPI